MRLLPGFCAQDEYPLRKKPGTVKRVRFFLAEYETQEIVPQKDELSSAGTYSYEQALPLIQHESWRRILAEAHEFLMK